MERDHYEDFTLTELEELLKFWVRQKDKAWKDYEFKARKAFRVRAAYNERLDNES